jgi:hypothetical protein
MDLERHLNNSIKDTTISTTLRRRATRALVMSSLLNVWLYTSAKLRNAFTVTQAVEKSKLMVTTIYPDTVVDLVELISVPSIQTTMIPQVVMPSVFAISIEVLFVTQTAAAHVIAIDICKPGMRMMLIIAKAIAFAKEERNAMHNAMVFVHNVVMVAPGIQHALHNA